MSYKKQGNSGHVKLNTPRTEDMSTTSWWTGDQSATRLGGLETGKKGTRQDNRAIEGASMAFLFRISHFSFIPRGLKLPHVASDRLV